MVLNLIALSLVFSSCDDSTTSATDPCEGITCSEHGTCTVEDLLASCDCDTGYVAEGLTCVEVVVGPCTDVTCDDHGTCGVVGEDPGLAVCQCDEGFHEENYVNCVETDPGDPCEGITCDDHGTCTAVDGEEATDPVCECDDGYTLVGDIHCAENDPCEGVTCSDHGTCAVVGEGPGLPVCECDEGYVAVDLTCVEAGCGDGIVNVEGEECDDGNDFDGDGCTTACLFSCHPSDDCAQDPNECVIHECTEVENGMMCAPVPVEGSCDDGDDCTGPDLCDAGVCGGAVLPLWYLDADHDDYGDAANFICADTEPAGYVSDATDCCDEVHNANPLQTQYFQNAYQCGGVNVDLWDYDCDTVIERQYMVFEDCTGATTEAACGAASGWATTTLSIPDCGVQAMYSFCRWVGGACSVVGTQPMYQSCR
jgi:cysteine-rich repeat protein